ncbi:MAG: DNA polymerase/3'-5' exonuclease PolX [Methanomicrobiales archaeon]|nr:DNA polymerase/3'-5' exonuclease PolX [Methanomicrobiales archaeon]
MARKAMSNQEIASVLYEIADLLELKGVEWKPRAYRKAAQSVETLGEPIVSIYERGELKKIPGIGESISEKIQEMIEKGKLQYLEDLRSEFPEGVREMENVEGVGPKTALTLHAKLGIQTIDDLEKAARQGKIRALKGFGETSEKNILEGIQRHRNTEERFPLGYIRPEASRIEAQLRESDAVIQVVVAGSIRRWKETVGDIDILVSSSDPGKVMDLFCSLPQVKKVISKGEKKSTILVGDNLHVDLRHIEEKQFGAGLMYFTGSKAHNIALRKRALSQGMTLSEYGLVRKKGGDVVAEKEEAEIYEALGLPYIPPELRENRGEIDAAEAGNLPQLLQQDQIRGDLHVHSEWSEGNDTIAELAKKAAEMRYEYLAICDHAKSLGIARGLTEEDLKDQRKEIDTVNESLDDLTILAGIEANIGSGGHLDLKREALKDLDLVIAGIHSGLKQDEKKMTERVITAIHEEPVHMIVHPTGRVLQKRPPLNLNLQTIYETAAEQGVLLEINAFPTRLDLSDIHARAAKDKGVLMGIGTDTHDVTHLRYMELGVATARRGWLEKKDVINTRSVKEFRKLLRT